MSLCLPVRDSLTFPPESASLPPCAIVTRKWRAKEQSQLAPSLLPRLRASDPWTSKMFHPIHSLMLGSVARKRSASPSFLPLSPSLSLAFLTPYFISGGGGGGAAVYRVGPPKSRDMKYNRAIRAHVFFRELLFRTSHSHSLTPSPATNKSAARPLHPRTRRRRAAQPSSLFRIRSLYRGATKGGRPRSLFALILYPSFRLRGQVDSQCKSCLVTDNFPQQICQGNIKLSGITELP